jgi:uncharacterized protein YbaR (Trm112 family)
LNRKQPKECPYCQGVSFNVFDRKYAVTELLKCKNCKLNFRFPQDTPAFLEKFYKSNYQIDTHMMTKLPSDEALVGLKENNFSNLRDVTPFMSVLVPQSSKVIDYGCSWGYSVFQMRSAGFDAKGLEISTTRGAFGREKLGVSIVSRQEEVENGNELIVSSHVIEHLASIPSFVNFCREKLNPQGIFMAFCPNGSVEYKNREPEIFHVNWGFLHPNYLDIDFATHMFSKNPYLILTGDWEYNLDEMKAWDGISQVIGNKRDGKELLIIAKPRVLLAASA